VTTNILATLLDAMGTRQACVIHDGDHAYRCCDLAAKVSEYDSFLKKRGCTNTVITLLADYSFDSIAMLLAAWRVGNVVALLTKKSRDEVARLGEVCEATHLVTVHGHDAAERIYVERTGHHIKNALLLGLMQAGEPGFVIFSSGTTGTPKSSLHRLQPLLEKHSGASRVKAFKTISFLLFDHIGGLNTVLNMLFSGGELVCIPNRTPDVVCAEIQKHGVQALITSPTFLNLLLLSGAVHRYDLSSLQVINYGTEPMSEATLEALHKSLPNTRLSQAYGATEIGVIPTRSESSRSKWMRIGGDGCDVRIVDGLLEVKTKTTMIGYLNAENPFTPDGYFRTGDTAVQRGEFIQVLGRHSELINVGGEKFFPIEVESVLQQMAGVVEVSVSKTQSPLVGQIVTAAFRLEKDEPRDQFRKRLFEFCRGRLSPARVPVKISITEEPLHTQRFKKLRLQTNGV
jgi:long-chain acyl-CoA synthetase